MDNKNILVAVIVFVVVLGVFGVGGRVIVDKIAERVIEKIRKEYSPGPYQPGFDPDKISPDFFRNQQQGPPPQQFQQPQSPPPQQFQQPGPPQNPGYGRSIGRPEDWNRVWEGQRR